MPHKILCFDGGDAVLDGSYNLIWYLPQKMLSDIDSDKIKLQLISCSFNGTYTVDSDEYSMQSVNILSNDLMPTNYSSTSNKTECILGICNVVNDYSLANKFNVSSKLLQEAPTYEVAKSSFYKLTVFFDLMGEHIDLNTVDAYVSKSYTKLIFKVSY